MLNGAEHRAAVSGFERNVGGLHRPELVGRAGPERWTHVEVAAGVAGLDGFPS
jgi:hypothetical protein